ncbi:MAG: hypothetical protein GY803_29095 [Chloroflexi bacterium]|nr:hypothetical protein [Chloroflexota bacterium]
MNTATKITLEKEKYALIKRHIEDRKAHFNRDVEALLAGMVDDQIIVRDGQIATRSLSKAKEQFQAYFQGSTFHEWDDLEPPIIRVSEDGRMAYMVNRVRVRYSRQSNNGEQPETSFVCAWLMVYEKRGNDWVAVANASTFEP